jgi:hypothetical protein
MLNALDDSSQLITRNLDASAHGLLLVKMTNKTSAIHAAASRRADERGEQLVNNCRGASPARLRMRQELEPGTGI